MRYLSEIFWRHSWNVCRLFLNTYKFLVCLSVCQLAHFLTEIRHIKGYLQFWMRYLSEIFWTQSWYIYTPFLNIYKLFVCLSFHQLAYLLTEFRPIKVYRLSWKSYMSVRLLVGLLPNRNQAFIGISPVLDEISFLICLKTFL